MENRRWGDSLDYKPEKGRKKQSKCLESSDKENCGNSVGRE